MANNTGPSPLDNIRREFPKAGLSYEEVMARLTKLQASDADIHSPRNFRPSYFVGQDIIDLIKACHDRVVEQNVLYAGSSFPSLRQIERDVVDFALDLLNAPAGAAGNVTIGGSESNFMALKTARDFARAKGVSHDVLEIVLAHTAHPSLEKAAEMLGMRARRAMSSIDFRADVAQMEALVGPATIMIVASAPPAAYATIDPVAEIGALAAKHDLWFHVDCCMGGFFIPFAEQLGEPIPVFDFRLPSVSSMSADLHKFGYAPKGASVLLLRDADRLKHQEYRFESWPFGHYATMGVAGSRPAAPLVSAWAVMQRLGREGYLDIARRIVALRKQLEQGIRSIPGLQVVGTPAAAHLFMASDELDIFAIDERLERQGFLTARAWHPDSVQLWVNLSHDEVAIKNFLTDLSEAAEAVRTSKDRAVNREAVYSR